MNDLVSASAHTHEIKWFEPLMLCTDHGLYFSLLLWVDFNYLADFDSFYTSHPFNYIIITIIISNKGL